jgi:hypothetical protein
MAKRKHADRTLTSRRVEELVGVLLDGAVPEWDVCAFVREQEKEAGSAWFVAEGESPLSASQIRRYHRKANDLIERSCERSRRKLLRRHRAQRRHLYAKTVAAGDYRTALAVLRDLGEMEGLYPPRRVALSDDPRKKPDALSPEQTAAALAALRARLGQGAGGPPADGQDDGGGPAVGGPLPRPEGSGADARPLAGGGAAHRLGAGVAPLFAPGR